MPAPTAEKAIARTRAGRPRSEPARQAILSAALQILEESGLHALTMEGIAARAGVGKATLYRWWPSRGHVALDALLQELVEVAPPLDDLTPLREVLVEQARALGRSYAVTARGRAILAILGDMQRDPDLSATFRERLLDPRRAPIRAALRAAQARGEIRAEVGVELIIDLVYAPLYLRLLMGHAPLTEPLIDEMVDAVLRGVSCAAPVTIRDTSNNQTG